MRIAFYESIRPKARNQLTGNYMEDGYESLQTNKLHVRSGRAWQANHESTSTEYEETAKISGPMEAAWIKNNGDDLYLQCTYTCMRVVDRRLAHASKNDMVRRHRPGRDETTPPMSRPFNAVYGIGRARVAQWLEAPLRQARGIDFCVHSPPSLPSLRGRQIGTRLVWEDSSTGSIHQQATTSHCKGQICIKSPQTILNEVECMPHPSGIDQRRELYPLSFLSYDTGEELFLGTCDSTGVGGIGVLVNTSLSMNIDSFEQLTTRIGRLRLKICGSIPALTIFVADAPTSNYDEEEVAAFYMDLENREDHTFFKVIIGDFNAEIGPRRSSEERHIGTHGFEWNEQEASSSTMDVGISQWRVP
uniref:Craniofacial development protein 2-like n=1 Tax=Angiostrongylus cantonensis TaxID=6313 RepID=A0A0K0DE01_ANGCA